MSQNKKGISSRYSSQKSSQFFSYWITTVSHSLFQTHHTTTFCLIITQETSHITFGSAEERRLYPEADPRLYSIKGLIVVVVVGRILPLWSEQSVNVARFSPPSITEWPFHSLLSFLPSILQVPRPKLSLSSWKMSRTFLMGSFADTIGDEGSLADSSTCWKVRNN